MSTFKTAQANDQNTGIVGRVVRGGESVVQSRGHSHLQDNWRERNNEKPLIVTRRKMY